MARRPGSRLSMQKRLAATLLTAPRCGLRLAQAHPPLPPVGLGFAPRTSLKCSRNSAFAPAAGAAFVAAPACARRGMALKPPRLPQHTRHRCLRTGARRALRGRLRPTPRLRTSSTERTRLNRVLLLLPLPRRCLLCPFSLAAAALRSGLSSSCGSPPRPTRPGRRSCCRRHGARLRQMLSLPRLLRLRLQCHRGRQTPCS